jgi:RimJ/RimL family protein N-acetyltransferase
MTVAPFTLRGQHVVLEPLTLDHAEGLVAASSRDRTSFGWTEVPPDLAAMTAYIEALLAQRDADTAVPFAQRRVADDRLVGCTRFLELRWYGATDAPIEVEIGGTWLSADAQRSRVNSEAKFLLLEHAFETWRVQRVALCTDARNERSRAAIERIGARFEGILRHHRPSAVPAERGRMRDTALFAMTDDDWPEVRAAMAARLGR